MADEVGENGVGEGALGSPAGGVVEEVDGEGEVWGGEEGAEGLVRAGGIGGGGGSGEQGGEDVEASVCVREDGGG